MAKLYSIFAHLFEQKAQHEKHPNKTTEYRSILLHANGKFIGILQVF